MFQGWLDLSVSSKEQASLFSSQPLNTEALFFFLVSFSLKHSDAFAFHFLTYSFCHDPVIKAPFMSFIQSLLQVLMQPGLCSLFFCQLVIRAIFSINQILLSMGSCEGALAWGLIISTLLLFGNEFKSFSINQTHYAPFSTRHP